MTSNARKRLSAWLGLAAMWLAVGMPLVSQMLAAHRAEAARVLDVAFCTVEGDGRSLPAVMRASAQAHGSDATHAMHADGDHASPMSHGAHDSQSDLCGYCSLLANHPPLVMPALTGAVSFAWIARAGPLADRVASHTQPARTPPARAPPAFS
ncbi:hypothetical protein PCA31118_00948 [Pandoraea captiosa]|uniref:DUF2946 domain-containing protein n=1 Tax=Pandoraea captiosa TaxID=2508302 RepID=A0A5E4ZLK5_9BURK|nr:DUF2946 domain-containing protein [Pandoraea captiosa]VVE62249.1 hypothetical protein PCA31118_00948 [Pandoraea captiosa]